MELNLETIPTNISTTPSIQKKFYQDVIDGLSCHPKKLSSKYFYNKNGDRLFQRIMAMPEYYLTRCEMDIFSNKTQELANIMTADRDQPFDLIELGAGDALKSTYLLKYLVQQRVDFTYMPIDISGNILSILSQKLETELPRLDIFPLEGEYFEMLDKANALSNKRKIVLFLGSNIGNMELEEAYAFCKKLKGKMNKGDVLVVGFDLRKNPTLILNAYNDQTGITAAFNLNLLVRINSELGANFDLKQFQHYQHYDPISGACRSYLVSLIDQKVTIADQTIQFQENELTYMEVSQKFSSSEIEQLAGYAGFDSIGEISDAKKWFVDAVWQVK